MRRTYIISIAFFLLISCADYDVVIRNGMIYDGTGEKPYSGDVAINNDKIGKVSKSINVNLPFLSIQTFFGFKSL